MLAAEGAESARWTQFPGEESGGRIPPHSSAPESSREVTAGAAQGWEGIGVEEKAIRNPLEMQGPALKKACKDGKWGLAGTKAGICLCNLSPPPRNKCPFPAILRLVSLTRTPKEAVNHSAWDQSEFFLPWTFSNWNSRENCLSLWGRGRVMAGKPCLAQEVRKAA